MIAMKNWRKAGLWLLFAVLIVALPFGALLLHLGFRDAPAPEADFDCDE